MSNVGWPGAGGREVARISGRRQGHWWSGQTKIVKCTWQYICPFLIAEENCGLKTLFWTFNNDHIVHNVNNVNNVNNVHNVHIIHLVHIVYIVHIFSYCPYYCYCLH